jgi:hypothetical protein
MKLEKTKQIYDILLDASRIVEKNASVSVNTDIQQTKNNNLKLAKLRPALRDVKEGTELVVAASELFAIIGGLFAL